MNVCSSRNPNVCVDCEALTLDDSSTLICQTGVHPTPGSVDRSGSTAGWSICAASQTDFTGTRKAIS